MAQSWAQIRYNSPERSARLRKERRTYEREMKGTYAQQEADKLRQDRLDHQQALDIKRFDTRNMTADQRERNRLTDIRDRFSRNLEARKFNQQRITEDRFTYETTDDSGISTTEIGYYSQGLQNKKIRAIADTVMKAKDKGAALAALSPEDRATFTAWRQFEQGKMSVPQVGEEVGGAGTGTAKQSVFAPGGGRNLFDSFTDDKGVTTFYNKASKTGQERAKKTGVTSEEARAKLQQKTPTAAKEERYAGIPETGNVMSLPPVPTGAQPDPYIWDRVFNALNVGGPEGVAKRSLAANLDAQGIRNRQSGTIPSTGQGWTPAQSNRRKPRTFENNLSGRIDRIVYDALRGGFRNF